MELTRNKEKILRQLRQRVENFISKSIKEKSIRKKLEAYENNNDDSLGDAYDINNDQVDDFELLDEDTN